ncbi:hypothetical protein JN535_04265 [Cellulosimicrobium cellulans]|uniref:DUF7426 family protein n=1 Tax=Cellulosimicrobium cellulans TaxID=1710 RepID=UPI001964AE0E|nr:hypothetical protein [Cellulosimicrobium cellulans]MBN0039389.1 hypothetical protein [Cellulosimicrobium cellulans]
MSVDFSAWAVPSLDLTLGGRTFTVRPPSVGDMGKVLACAVRGEVNLGIAKGPIPADVQAVLDTIGPDDHPALGNETFREMVDAGVHPTTINRVAYYCVFYWARGKDVADIYATWLWSPRDAAAAEQAPAEEDDDLPKAPPTSRRSSGHGSGSANRSAKTSRASRSSRTTGSRSG